MLTPQEEYDSEMLWLSTNVVTDKESIKGMIYIYHPTARDSVDDSTSGVSIHGLLDSGVLRFAIMAEEADIDFAGPNYGYIILDR